MIISSTMSDSRGQKYSKNLNKNKYSSNSSNTIDNNMNGISTPNQLPENKQVAFGSFIAAAAIWEVFKNVLLYSGARAVIDVAIKGVGKLVNYVKGLKGYGTKLGTDATARAEKATKVVSDDIADRINKIANRNPQTHPDQIIDIFGEKLNRVIIPLKGDGYEQGLNKVIGLAKLKTDLYNDVLMPLCETMDGKPKQHYIPNGINFFGPKGTGKTYFAEQLGEHYVRKGGYFNKIKLSNDSVKDIETLDKAFANAEANFVESGNKKYTMIYIDEIEKYFSKDNSEQKPTIARLLELSNNCRDRGAILTSTSNYLDQVEPSLLRTGRTDLRIPIGHVPDYDLMDMLNYYLKKDGIPHDTENIDFEAIRQAVKTEHLEYKPKDIETRLLKEADNVADYGGQMTTESIKDALLLSKPEFNDAERLQFAADKAFAKQLGGIYEY